MRLSAEGKELIGPQIISPQRRRDRAEFPQRLCEKTLSLLCETSAMPLRLCGEVASSFQLC